MFDSIKANREFKDYSIGEKALVIGIAFLAVACIYIVGDRVVEALQDKDLRELAATGATIVYLCYIAFKVGKGRGIDEGRREVYKEWADWEDREAQQKG